MNIVQVASPVITLARRRWVPALVTGLCFLAGGALGFAISRGNDGIAALWPANGILLSALLLAAPGTKRFHAIVCAAASVYINRWAGTTLGLSAIFTGANLVTVALAYGLLRRWRCGNDMFESLAGTARFVAAAGLAIAAGSTIAATAAAMGGHGFGGVWLSWASSDLIGIVLIVSFTLTYAQHRRAGARRDGAPAGWQLSACLLMVFIAAVAVFAQGRFPLLFMPLAFLILATYRANLLGAVGGILIIAVVGWALTAVGLGPVALIKGSVALRVQFFQIYLVTIYAVCLPLALLLTERRELNRRLDESERRHRRILERSREVIFETDIDGRWTYLNPAWEVLTGYRAAESLGQSFLKVIAPADRGPALARLAALYAREIDECHQDLRYLNADPAVGERWASVRSHLLLDERGVLIGTYGTLHDVTAERAAEQARATSEARYRLLAEHSNDMIVQLTMDGVRRYVSPSSSIVLGYEPHELVDRAVSGDIHPDDRSLVVATSRTLLDGVENPICIYRQRHKDGHYVWLEASYRLIRDPETHEPTGFIASVRDVGRREQAELERVRTASELQEANRLLTMAEALGQIGHWRVDMASRAVYWSDVVCQIHGLPSGYAPDISNAIAFYHPDDRQIVQSKVAEALEHGTPYAFQARLVRPNGDIRYVDARGHTERDPSGSMIGLFGVIHDVTEARLAERALEETSQRLTRNNLMLTMAETVARLGHWRIDAQSGALLWSDEVYAIYGMARSVTPTMDMTLALYHPDDVLAVRATIDHAMARGIGYTSNARVLRPDGKLIHVSTRCEVERDADGRITGYFGIVQDVSDQAEAEALLRDREARFRLITEQAGDIIALHGADATCRFVSPAVRTVLGYDPDDLLGTTLDMLVAEGDVPLLATHWTRLGAGVPGTVSTLRFRMRHADGHHVWVEASSRLADYLGDICMVSVCRDIGAQVVAEAQLREAREQAEAAVRTKASFLANMSHEIRTPMNGVIGFTDLLLLSDLSADQRRQAELIADSGRAMMRLLNDILDLSKVEAGLMTIAEDSVDLPHALRACMKLIMPAASHKQIDLDCDFADDLPRMIVGDGLRLRQVVLNLLGNAVKFTEEGTITLSARVTAGPAPAIVIEVRDTGIGIAPERQAAVFEQFVQAERGTASRFGGTGLGLAISAELARLMHGELTLTSVLGEGTSFCLTLPLRLAAAPLVARQAALAAPADDAPGDLAEGVRVLVAEDHDVNQLLMQSMLKRLNCQVDIADTGRVAIEQVIAAKAQGRPYALVLMDMQMPDVDGVEATRQIRALGVTPQELPIVALTANAYADDVAACIDAGMQAHLAKPIRLDLLQAALKRWTALPLAPTAPNHSSRFSPKIEQRYRERKAEVMAALDALIDRGIFADDEVVAVAELHHKLAGTAGMFGDDALGALAQAFDTDAAGWHIAERAARVREHVAAMRKLVPVDAVEDPDGAAAVA